MPRTIEPELLDTLPPDHPDAQHSRRDLRLINRIMGNHRWFARTLPRCVKPGESILEIGAGTGELVQRLAKRQLEVHGLDLWPAPAEKLSKTNWHSADLKSFAGYAAYPVIVGNLIFHQFKDDELAEIGAAVRSHARLIVACEPARRALSQDLFARVAPLLGANRVTLHDARVSIAAGFLDEELPHALGLHPARWDFKCSTTVLGAYRMVACRR